MIDLLQSLKATRKEMMKFGFGLDEFDFIEFVNHHMDMLRKPRKTYDVLDQRIRYLDREQLFIEEYNSRKLAYLNKVVKRKETVRMPLRDAQTDHVVMQQYDLRWHTSSIITERLHELYRCGGAYISTSPWSVLHSPAVE